MAPNRNANPIERAEDGRWRRAGVALGLKFENGSGKGISTKRATRANPMHGKLEGRQVRAECGLRDVDDGIVVIEVELARPLRLGLVASSYRGPARPRGPGPLLLFSEPGALRVDLRGIHQKRIDHMASATESGRALVDGLKKLGARGWVELRDDALEAQIRPKSERPEAYVGVVRLAVEVAKLAEAARAELGDEEWERRLADGFAAAADAFGLELDRGACVVRGEVRGVRVSVALVTDDRHSIAASARFRCPLPPGSKLEPRVGFWSALAEKLGFAPDKKRFDARFRLEGDLSGRVDDALGATIVALAERGHVVADAHAISFRTSNLETDATELVGTLVSLAEALVPPLERSPYR